MKINFYASLIVTLVLAGCGIPKEQYEAVVDENKQLQEQISQMENEIKALKETDRYYYQSGADAFSSGNYESAIDWMNKLKLKFPQSTLQNSADKIISDSNAAIKAAYAIEKEKLNKLLSSAKKAELSEAITILSSYIAEDHPSDLIQSAQESLSNYQKKWEAEASIREVEQNTGIRLSDYKTGWSVSGSLGKQLYVPQIQLKFKNITSGPLSGPIEIIVNFTDDTKGEVFGDGSTYLLFSHDTPIQAGIVKTAYVSSSVGYTRYNHNPPAITAEIYLEKDRNRLLYKKIPIKRGEM
jgi:hypothetical protein